MTTGLRSTEAMRPGDIYGCKTAPITPFSPADTGRYAALKIVFREDDLLFFVVRGHAL
ncbi:MAG: hypothetical protein KTR21_18390 [Rhodobacteraceae bacterium]|nr:hypothetical protein [Paracoccaceae bacterium]